jgi:hypothetical protein
VYNRNPEKYVAELECLRSVFRGKGGEGISLEVGDRGMVLAGLQNSVTWADASLSALKIARRRVSAVVRVRRLQHLKGNF